MFPGTAIQMHNSYGHNYDISVFHLDPPFVLPDGGQAESVRLERVIGVLNSHKSTALESGYIRIATWSEILTPQDALGSIGYVIEGGVSGLILEPTLRLSVTI